MGAYVGVIVVIGEPALVAGYAMAGATIMPVRGPDEVRRAWETLPSGTTLVILTASAADALGGRLSEPDPLTAVMPA
jgi:vacuolar-type H+-ATPase subunit F/Vma7